MNRGINMQFTKSYTYSQVIALFALAAGLSVDCVRQNHPEYLPKLMEGIADVIEDELVAWINENGGWVSTDNRVSVIKLAAHRSEISICFLLSILTARPSRARQPKTE